MTSSMTTTANGVKVVTSVIPMEENTEFPDVKASSELKKPILPPTTRVFLKGMPMMLGLVQLFTGFMMISLCTITLLFNYLHADFVVFLGLPFAVSGIVAIVAHQHPLPKLIKVTLSTSIICVLLAAAGIGYFSWELTFRPDDNNCIDVENSWSCWEMRWKFFRLMDGVRGLLLVLSCLELCVCITLSIFSARAIRQDKTNADVYGSDCSLLKDGVDS